MPFVVPRAAESSSGVGFSLWPMNAFAISILLLSLNSVGAKGLARVPGLVRACVRADADDDATGETRTCLPVSRSGQLRDDGGELSVDPVAVLEGDVSLNGSEGDVTIDVDFHASAQDGSEAEVIG